MDAHHRKRPDGFGLTIPLGGVGLLEHEPIVRQLPDLGYTDLWTGETNGIDGFTPLTLAAAWDKRLRLGTGVIPAATRGLAVLAQTAATMAAIAPGRFALGIGVSTPRIVEDWNGVAFNDPYTRIRDTLRFLRRALSGERISEEYETFRVRGFQLANPPETSPPLFVGALRPRMLQLAGTEADGAVLNMLSADDVAKVASFVREGDPKKEVIAKIIVCPDDLPEIATTIRFILAHYLNIPVYRRFHEWLGRGEVLADFWAAWDAGDRQRAVETLPTEVLDELVVSGDPDECRAGIQRYVDNGVSVPVLGIPTTDGTGLIEFVKQLGPAG